MILFFGPPGAGKSVQGQILAARHGWRWLSSGQLLRDLHNTELTARLQTGELVDDRLVNQVITDALKRAQNLDHVILDGFPRRLSQVKWLIKAQPDHQRAIKLVVILEVPNAELVRRLKLRGRLDDTEYVINERLQIYRQEIYPILTYLTEQKVQISHIDGTGTVGQVHDRIEAELEAALPEKKN